MPEVPVPQLALDDGERYALAGHLDRVRVAKLVRREAPADSSADGKVAQRAARGGWGPRPASGRSLHDAQQGADR